MAQLIQGSGKELAVYLERFPSRNDLMLIIPSEEPLAPEETTRQAENINRMGGQRDPDLVARVRSVRGKFAHLGTTLATDDLHCERQADKEKEERRIEGFKP